MNQTKFKLKYILLKYVYCGHQDFSTSLLPRSTVTGPYQLLLKAQPGVFVLRNGSFSEVRVSGVLRNWVCCFLGTEGFLLVSLILSLQSRSLSQRTMLDYCWGTGHHLLPPAPETVSNQKKSTYPNSAFWSKT